MTDYYVSAGQTVSGLVLHSGDSQYVESGGIAENTIVESGGVLDVSSGGEYEVPKYYGVFIQSGGIAIFHSGVSGSLYEPQAAVGADLLFLPGTRFYYSAGYYGSPQANRIYRGVELVSSGQLVGSGSPALSSVTGAGVVEYVLPSGTISGATISSGGVQNVYVSGTAIHTTIGNGGVQNIGYDDYGQLPATATDTVIMRGGVQTVISGADVSTTTVRDGGTQAIGTAGTVSTTTIHTGGYEIVSKGGMTSDTTVSSGGELILLPGAAASDTLTIANGGTVLLTGVVLQSAGLVLAATTAPVSGTVVGSSGMQLVLPGGLTVDTVLADGGRELVLSGGIASATDVTSATIVVSQLATTLATSLGAGGVETILSGGAASGTTIGSGGIQVVSGRAVATMVLSSGEQFVQYAGVVSGGTIVTGGLEFVASGALAKAESVQGGTQTVSGGLASATYTTLGNGALQQIENDGFANATQIGSGATQLLDNGIVRGSVIDQGGYEVVRGGQIVSATDVQAGGTLFIISGKAVSTTVASGGTVISAGASIVLSAGRVSREGQGVLSANVVSGNEIEYVLAGALAEDVKVKNGAALSAFAGATVMGATIIDGALNAVGAILSGGLVESHGSVTLSSGSVATDLAVGHNGTVEAFSGTQLNGGVVQRTGAQLIGSGARADGTVLMGMETVQSGAVTSGTFVESGGVQYSEYDAVAFGTTVASGGSLINGGSSEAAVLQPFAIESTYGQADDTTIKRGAELIVNGGFTSNTTIMAGGTFDLATFAYVSGGSAVLNQVDQLVIVQGETTVTVQLAGSYAGESFHLAADAHGGTLVTVSAAGALDPAALRGDFGAAATPDAPPEIAIEATAALWQPAPQVGADLLDHILQPHPL